MTTVNTKQVSRTSSEKHNPEVSDFYIHYTGTIYVVSGVSNYPIHYALISMNGNRYSVESTNINDIFGDDANEFKKITEITMNYALR